VQETDGRFRDAVAKAWTSGVPTKAIVWKSGLTDTSVRSIARSR
jgi:hypothetical protein